MIYDRGKYHYTDVYLNYNLGTSVGQLKRIETAEEIISRIEKECEEGIKASSGLIA